jgi:hypothetical protein
MARGRSPSSGDEVDRLYQVPLAEFTRSRDELAKQAGPGGTAIRKLQKPSLPAWAVNQLYWHRRKVWDRLIDAAGRVRAAHQKRLSGKGGDVEAAETDHRDAVRAAADEIREWLGAAGETTSPATVASVIETLQTLPGVEPAGRLTRPLKPLGLEALAGLLPAGRSSLKAVEPRASAAPSPAPRRRSKADLAGEARAARRAAKARTREAARLDAGIREAVKAERRAAADLGRARQTLARAERERTHVAERLQFLERQVTQAAADVRAHEARAAEAAGTRAALEARRRTLDDGD